LAWQYDILHVFTPLGEGIILPRNSKQGLADKSVDVSDKIFLRGGAPPVVHVTIRRGIVIPIASRIVTTDSTIGAQTE
jgi:hypothetical protein